MLQNVTLSAMLMSDLVLERLLPRLASPPRQLFSHVAMLERATFRFDSRYPNDAFSAGRLITGRSTKR